MTEKGSRFLLFSVILISTVILQTVVLGKIPLFRVKPDLALIVLIFFAYRRGSMEGQTAGFLTGMLEDLLSLSPLGFNALIKTVMGFLYGIASGSFYIDPIFIPMGLAVIATFVKAVFSILFAAIFQLQSVGLVYIAGRLWIELGLNVILAPFIFAFLNLFKSFKLIKESEL